MEHYEWLLKELHGKLSKIEAQRNVSIFFENVVSFNSSILDLIILYNYTIIIINNFNADYRIRFSDPFKVNEVAIEFYKLYSKLCQLIATIGQPVGNFVPSYMGRLCC